MNLDSSRTGICIRSAPVQEMLNTMLILLRTRTENGKTKTVFFTRVHADINLCEFSLMMTGSLCSTRCFRDKPANHATDAEPRQVPSVNTENSFQRRRLSQSTKLESSADSCDEVESARVLDSLGPCVGNGWGKRILADRYRGREWILIQQPRTLCLEYVSMIYASIGIIKALKRLIHKPSRAAE